MEGAVPVSWIRYLLSATDTDLPPILSKPDANLLIFPQSIQPILPSDSAFARHFFSQLLLSKLELLFPVKWFLLGSVEMMLISPDNPGLKLSFFLRYYNNNVLRGKGLPCRDSPSSCDNFEMRPFPLGFSVQKLVFGF